MTTTIDATADATANAANAAYDDIYAGTEIDIGVLPGCTNVKFERVDRPAFLDRALNACLVKTHVFDSLDRLIAFVQATDGRLHVLSCRWAAAPDILLSKPRYVLRCAESPLGILAPLVGRTAVEGVTLDGISFNPLLSMSLAVDTGVVSDLNTAHGRAETARQLGEYLLRGIEKWRRDRDTAAD